MKRNPLVSCICVSGNRTEHLKKAITYFMAQTYKQKELIIVSAAYDPAYEAIAGEYTAAGVRYHAVAADTAPTLGELRNVAIGLSAGEYFCVWDDDDWFHCRRIELQIEEARRNGKQGSVLPYYILFDATSREAFMSVPLPPPASILCRKKAVTAMFLYKPLNRSEDASFVHDLNRKNILYPLVFPALYIYIYHGSNTWNHSHFRKLCGRRFSKKVSQLVGDIVEGRYSCEEGSALLGAAGVLKEYDYFLQWQ